MPESLRRLYVSGKLPVEMLANAVIKGWITEDQKKVILSSK